MSKPGSEVCEIHNILLLNTFFLFKSTTSVSVVCNYKTLTNTTGETSFFLLSWLRLPAVRQCSPFHLLVIELWILAVSTAAAGPDLKERVCANSILLVFSGSVQSLM